MSDNVWRKKKYYPPRILLDLADLTATPLGDVLVCLTGSERGILQNLLDYANRRSTWVSEYQTDYYLAPTEEEWDNIQAAVAELEDKLMGCSEWEALLEDIKTAVQCACDQLTAMPDEAWPSGGVLDGQRDYDDYESPVEYNVGDPPEGFATWDDWTQYKCKAAQRIVDDLTDLGERMEVWYTTGAAITFAAFQSFVLASAAAPPVAAVLGIVGILAIAGTALAMIAFQQWLAANKQDLVCLIHFSDTVQDARAGILAYIDEEWDLALGKPFGAYLFSYDVLSKCYDGGLDVSGYSASYCESCEEPWSDWREWNFPSDTDWDVSDAKAYYDGDGRLYITDLGIAYSPVMTPPAGTYDVAVDLTGCDDGGGACCVLSYQYSNNGVDWLTWIDFGGCNTAACPGSSEVNKFSNNAVWAYAYLRIKAQAVPGHYQKIYQVQQAWTAQ